MKSYFMGGHELMQPGRFRAPLFYVHSLGVHLVTESVARSEL